MAMMMQGGQANAIHRTVVLLRPNEKKHLFEMARRERVSASEIVRRSIEAYKTASVPPDEEQELKAAFSEMNKALDAALDSIRSARAEVQQNLAEIHERREQHA